MSKNFAAQDGTGTAITGGIVNFDSSIVPAVDGSLTPIATDFTASDPTANTAGASTSPYSTPYLLRWIVKGLQAVFSKFSAGVALSDTDANPTTTSVGAKGQLWDGSQWIRSRQAVTGSITSLLGIANTIGLGRYNATPFTLGDLEYRAFQLSKNAELITSEIDILGSLTSITAADSGSTTVTGQSGQSIVTGAPTAGSFVSIAPTGDSTFSARVSGTFVGTLQFERTVDGVSWNPISADVAGLNFNTSQITSIGSFHGNASSCIGVRVRCLTLTSGSPSVQLMTGAGVNTIRIGNPLRFIDPITGAIATVKPPSTPVAATDTAIVVDVRNYPAPVVQTATIAASASLSGAIALNSAFPVGLLVPTGWTAANITFQGSIDGGTTYNTARTSGGSEVTVNVTLAGDNYNLNPLDFALYTHVKIRSGTFAAAVTQAASVSLSFVTRGSL